MAVLKVKCENQILLENSQAKPIVFLFFFNIVISKNPLFCNEKKSYGAARHLQLCMLWNTFSLTLFFFAQLIKVIEEEIQLLCAL